MVGPTRRPSPVLTRRQFLELAAIRSVGASLAASAVLAACRPTADGASALGLNPDGMNTLFALMDEIIPAGQDMPAASQVGTVAYLELLAGEDPAVGAVVRTSVDGVDALSAERGRGGLAARSAADRRALVGLLSESDPEAFAQVRGAVYEAYYLDPAVWDLLGYDPFPTGASGPDMAPFDPALLDRVRAGTFGYRAVRS